jgi:hypothetical protein
MNRSQDSLPIADSNTAMGLLEEGKNTDIGLVGEMQGSSRLAAWQRSQLLNPVANTFEFLATFEVRVNVMISVSLNTNSNSNSNPNPNPIAS